MNTQDVLNEFRDAGALREGHFVLSSGLHSPVFLQKNLVFMDGARCERLCKALAEKITAAVGAIDVAISPAVGGIIPGYETARHLKVRSMYVERDGGPYGVQQPAAVTLAFRLYDVSTGSMLCHGRFDEQQQSVMENLFTLGKAGRRGMTWLTAEELAREGLLGQLEQCKHLAK